MSDERPNLPRWSLRNSTLVLLVTVVFVGWGLYSYFTISRREDPEIKIATALVVTAYPGAGAEQVEQRVTRRLEDEIGSLDSLEELVSTTRAGISVIFVTVRYDADADLEWQKLRARVSEARSELPSSVIGPEVMDDFGDTTGMIVGFSGAGRTELTELAEDFEAELRRVESVGEIEIIGEVPEVVYLEGSRAELARYGLTPQRIAQLIELQNSKLPGGTVRNDRYEFRLDPKGELDSVERIAEAVIDVDPQTAVPVHVRNLFEVHRRPRDPPRYEVLHEGRETVAVGVVMKCGFNIVEMGREIRELLDDFALRLPPGVEMEVLHDSARHVDERIDGFTANLLEGIAIVIVAMALLMGLRAAAISAAAIPLSVLVAVALMPALSISLEMVSISALIVALGMLVDNSIIVADNVDVKLREGMAPSEAAWRGAHELTGPVVAGTLATAVAFLPMLLLTKEVGAYVRSLPLVVTVALVASLLIAMSLTPLMARAAMRRPRGAKGSMERTRTARAYRWLMRGCLRARWLVMALAVGALALGAWLLWLVGFSFFPDASRDQFTVDIWLKEGSALAETERVARLAEQQLLEDERVTSTLVHVGKGGPRFYITVMPEFSKSNYAQIMVNTEHASVTHDVIEKFNSTAGKRYPGARVFARKLVMGMPIEAPVMFRVIGDDLDQLRRVSKRIQAVLREVPGTTQVRDDVGPDVPSLGVEIDEERASRVGITRTDVALSLLSSYEGLELTSFEEGDDEIAVVMRLKEDERRVDGDPEGLPVASSVTGEKVPLGNIARIEPDFGAGVIHRRDHRRMIEVLSWTKGRLADEIVREAWPRIREMELPDGYRIEVAGEKVERDRAFGELLVVFGAILVGLLVLLLLQLGNMRRTLVVLAAVPLSIVGAAVGLWAGGFSFSFMAFLGVISLAGMAIKNSVVWIEFVERARDGGDPVGEAVIRAGIYRLRPILLTAATTIGGLTPLALFGGVLFEPMAWAMIAGLALVTVLTLIVVPILYAVANRDQIEIAPYTSR